MMIKKMLRRWRMWRREARVLRACGNICRCPECHDILNDQDAHYEIDGCVVYYTCMLCKNKSEWLFSAPVPILLSTDRATDRKTIKPISWTE